MNENPVDSKCIAFSKSFALLPNTVINPCCVYRSEKHTLPVDWSLDLILNNFKDRIIDNKCERCITKNALKQKSRKDNLEKYLEKYLFYYDLSFSNTCNFSCVMCNHSNSSKWVELSKNIFNMEVEQNKLSKEKLLQIIEHINKTSAEGKIFVEIKGGEPFLQKEFAVFIENLKHLKNISFKFTTNLSIINLKIFKLFPKMNSIKLDISLEGTEDLYEFIRIGSSWDTFVKNLNFIKSEQINYSFAPLILIYNSFNLFELKNFIEEYKPNTWKEQVLIGPSYLNVYNLPKHKKDIWIELYQDKFPNTYDMLISQDGNYNKFKEFHNKFYGSRYINKIKDIIDV